MPPLGYTILFGGEAPKPQVIVVQNPKSGGGGGRGFQRQPTVFEEMGTILLERFPVADRSLNRELARTLVLLQTTGAAEKIAPELDNPENDREQQIFIADVLSFLESEWDDGLVNLYGEC